MRQGVQPQFLNYYVFLVMRLPSTTTSN
jgi:hypothetical protein